MGALMVEGASSWAVQDPLVTALARVFHRNGMRVALDLDHPARPAGVA